MKKRRREKKKKREKKKTRDVREEGALRESEFGCPSPPSSFSFSSDWQREHLQ